MKHDKEYWVDMWGGIISGSKKDRDEDLKFWRADGWWSPLAGRVSAEIILAATEVLDVEI